MAAEERDTSRMAIKTYVPAYQGEIWDEHAEELDMSRSEFVRTMVQAGRRGFDPGGHGSETTFENTAPSEARSDPPEATPDDAAEPGAGHAFDQVVLAALEDECLSWEELFDALTDDVEDRLDETLQRLQAENEIQHSGKRGGYVRLE